MGELAASARRENSVSNKHESSFAPIKPSQVSSLERKKSNECSRDVETVSADIASGYSNSGNIRAGFKSNHGADERETDRDYIEDNAEKDENEELLPKNCEYEEDGEDKINYGDNDIDPRLCLRLFVSQTEKDRWMI